MSVRIVKQHLFFNDKRECKSRVLYLFQTSKNIELFLRIKDVLLVFVWKLKTMEQGIKVLVKSFTRH